MNPSIIPSDVAATAAANDLLELDVLQQGRRVHDVRELLAETGALLSSSLEYREILREVAELLVPRLADYCMLHLLESDGRYCQIAAVHRDPTKIPLLEELGRIRRSMPEEANSIMTGVLETARPVLTSAASYKQARAFIRDPAMLRLYRQLNPGSYMIVPLRARGQTLGSMTLAMSVSGRRYTADDLTVTEQLVGRAALAIDNARLFVAEQAARQRAERLQAITAALSQAMTQREV
nr:GAF domain-containing protein [Gemmatimonadota bacterium]